MVGFAAPSNINEDNTIESNNLRQSMSSKHENEDEDMN
jgi:hypothetical protein